MPSEPKNAHGTSSIMNFSRQHSCNSCTHIHGHAQSIGIDEML